MATKKPTLELINYKIDRLTQIHDFSTIQTAFLAVIFSLFIFSLSAIIVDYNPILTLISYLMIFIEIGILYGLLTSIFSGDWELKLASFSLAVWLTTYVPIYLGLSYVFIIIRQKIIGSYDIGNIDIVILLIISFALSFSIDKFVFEPKYRFRFKLLFIYPKKPIKYRMFESINVLLLKWKRKVGLSFVISTFITTITGIIPMSEGFGFPLYWLFREANKIWGFSIQNFLVDTIFFTIILLVIFTVIKHFRKNPVEKIKNTKWENTPYFIKIGENK